MKVEKFNEVYLKYRELRTSRITCGEWWDYLQLEREGGAEGFNKILKEVLKNSDRAKTRLKNYKESPLFKLKIRKYCNYHGYSDIDPYEVVRVISPRKIEIREMGQKLIESPVQFAGGFCAHTENQTQKWECFSAPEFPTRIITLVKAGWGKGQYRMSDVPCKFYDYNF